jgi:hypothetical protein
MMAPFIPKTQQIKGAAGDVTVYVEDDGGLTLVADDDFYRSTIEPDEAVKMALEILERKALAGLRARLKTGT